MNGITPAGYNDLADVAFIHVQSWRETYAGLVPQDYLDGLNVKERLEKWQSGYGAVEAGKQGLFIIRDGEKPAGFVSIGPARDDSYADYGEIYAVYLMKTCWHKGMGHALYEQAVEWFRSKGYAKAYLWVLDTNRSAIGAYERWGGRLDGDSIKHHEIGGQHIKEVQIVFDNI